MKKAKTIAFWILGFGALIFMLAFENISESSTPVRAIQIELDQPEHQLFLNKEDIKAILNNTDDSLLLKSIRAINTTLLEETLENHPFIAEAEVFSTLDGLISVHVKQKLAIARILQQDEHFYIDANGHPFPCSQNFSAKVPVITGQTDSTQIQSAYWLMQQVNKKDYFNHWLAEIHITKTNEYECIPVLGRHRVIFGDTTNTQMKLAKLEAFYKTAVSPENLNDWKTLNVAFNNLLVSTKY